MNYVRSSLALALVLIPSTFRLTAQSVHTPVSDRVDYTSVGTPLHTPPADPEIRAALKQVSVDRIKANINRLVDFHNRSTIS